MKVMDNSKISLSTHAESKMIYTKGEVIQKTGKIDPNEELLGKSADNS
ncbi:MAG: hypothetical protein M1402_03075 [Candidatus Thermoplasmatota archaeon]|nr:hypothetical protein [Candidatus Thermoplasmatota archaeon]